jgi:hypothetical protein
MSIDSTFSNILMYFTSHSAHLYTKEGTYVIHSKAFFKGFQMKCCRQVSLIQNFSAYTIKVTQTCSEDNITLTIDNRLRIFF